MSVQQKIGAFKQTFLVEFSGMNSCEDDSWKTTNEKVLEAINRYLG
ncbi:TPA: hypothetical protein I0I20_RS09200 [Enterococcus faecium]